MEYKANEKPKHGISLDYIKSVKAINSKSAARKGGISLDYISNITRDTRDNDKNISKIASNFQSDIAEMVTAPALKENVSTKSKLQKNNTAGKEITAESRSPLLPKGATTQSISRSLPTPRVIENSNQKNLPQQSVQNIHRNQQNDFRIGRNMQYDVSSSDARAQADPKPHKPMSGDLRIGRNVQYENRPEIDKKTKTLLRNEEYLKKSNSYAAVKSRIQNGTFDVNQEVDWDNDPNADKVSKTIKQAIDEQEKIVSDCKKKFDSEELFSIEQHYGEYNYWVNYGLSPKAAFEQMKQTYMLDDSAYKNERDFIERYNTLTAPMRELETLKEAYKERLTAEESKRNEHNVYVMETSAHNDAKFYEIALGIGRCKEEKWDPLKNDNYIAAVRAGAAGRGGVASTKAYSEDVKAFEESLQNPIAYIEKYRDEIKEETGTHAWTDGAALLDAGIYTPEYLYFTENEKLIYTYYAETQGRKKADEYMHSLMPKLTKRRADYRAENNGMDAIYNWAAENDLAAGALSIPSNLIGGISSLAGMVTGETDKQSGAFYLSNVTQALRSGATSDDSKVGAFLANVGLSIADNITIGAVFGPYAAPYAMATTAGGNAYNDAIQSGSSQEEATAYATMVGFIEWGTEKIPFDKLIELSKSGKSLTKGTLKPAIKEILEQAGTEAGEELVNSYATTLMDMAVRGDTSDYEQYVQMLMEQGLTLDEAQKQANISFFLIQPLESAAAGGVSGGAMSTGYMAVNTISQRSEAKNTNRGNELADKVNSGTQLTISEKKELLKMNAADPSRTLFESKTGVSLNGDFTQVSASLNAAASTAAKENAASAAEGKIGAPLEDDIDARLEMLRRQIAQNENTDEVNVEQQSIETELPEQGVEGDASVPYTQAVNQLDENSYADALESARVKQENIYGAELVRNAGSAAGVLNRGIRNPKSVSSMHNRGVLLEIGNGQSITSISIDDITEYSPQNRSGVSKNVMSQLRAAEAFAASGGLDVYFYDGRVTPVRGHSGEPVNGFRHKGSDGEYIAIDINSDAPMLFVFGHEMFHAMGKESESKLTKYLSDYLGDELSIEQAADKLGECLCDPAFCEYLVNKNRTLAQKVLDFIKDFIARLKGENVPQLNSAQKTLANALNKYLKEKREMFASEENSFMYRGKSDEGVDIFETSDEIKRLSWSEKLQRFKENFYNPESPHYLGTKIRFEYNGRIEFAEIDRYTKKENTDKLNPRRLNQWDKAKINVGADGDFILLTENAKYERFSKNNNKQKNDAHKKTEHFEYYIKEVRIDGKNYDVIVNIRIEESGNKFVYEVKLEQKKESSPQGPQIENNRRPKVQGTRLSEDSDNSISEPTDNVNSYMYAGIKAKNASVSDLKSAKQMESDGADGEIIRKKTGWHKGYDGEWRFEIDDKKMQFVKDGKFSNPDILRKNELEHRLLRLPDTMTEKEIDELRHLTSNLKGVKTRPETLWDYIEHDELFNAYPQLKNIPLRFKRLDGGRFGEYNPRRKEISVEERIRNNERQLKRTLVHEIQHAVQDIEGFAQGASPEYWKEKFIDQATKEKSRKIKAMIDGLDSEKRSKLDRMHMLDEMIEEIIMDENFKEDKTLREKYRQAENEMDKILNELRLTEWFRNLEEMQFAEPVVQGDPTSSYEKTAGEIEARDTGSRVDLNSEQRKNTRPNIDRKDVVFADESVIYHDANENDNSSIKHQIRAHIGELNNMEPVYTMQYLSISKKELKAKALEQFKKIGYKVDRQNFGVIDIGEKQINKSLDYINNDAEKAALLTVPAVLKRGIDISGHDNHKGRNYSTITIAAKVVINGKVGNVGAVVTQIEGKNKYKVHRILMPDGSEFIFEQKNDTELTSGESLSNNDKHAPIGPVPNTSISNFSDDVNNSFMSRSSHIDIGDGVRIKKMDAQTRASRNKIDSYTRKQYNDFGWVNVNDILTGKELKKLYTQFAEAKAKKYIYPKSANSEYMIAVGDKYAVSDKLVYIKGTIQHPVVTQVLAIIDDISDNEATNFIDEVVEYEQRGHDNAHQIIAAYEGKEIFRRYTVHDCVDYSKYKSGERSDSRADSDGGRGSIGRDSNEQGAFNDKVIRSSDTSNNSFMSRSSHIDIGDGVRIKKVDAQTRASRNKRFAAEYDLINRIAKRTRTKVQYVSSIMQNGEDLNGGCYYHRSSGTLYLNVNSDKALSSVFYRGLLHHIAESNSKGDNAFVRTLYNYVREFGKDAGWKGDVISQINEVLNGKTDTARAYGAFEEVFSSKVAEMFEDENFMRYVSRKNMTFLQKLWENIKNFIIRSLGGTYTPPLDVINAKTAEDIIGKMSDIQVLIADALDRQGRDRTKAASRAAKEITKTARKLSGKYAELNGEAYTEKEWQNYDSDKIEYEDITVTELRERVKKMPSALLDTLAREMDYTLKGETATARRAEFTEKVLSKLHPEDIVSVPNMPYKEGEISPLTAKEQKQNISALKKTGSIKTVRKYGYQNVADGVMVYVTNPSTIPLSNAHADNIAAGKSLAGALGFERIGYYTGEIRNINGREVKTESQAVISKDGTLYINLNADSPYTAIVGASWFENLRKTNTQTAVALVKAYDRYRKLTRSKADISQWIGRQLTGTHRTALFAGNNLFTEELSALMHMDASEILGVIEADPQFSNLIARGDLTLAQRIMDSIKGFFTKFGDTIARITGKTNRRAASALTIAQKNLLIAMRDAHLEGARAMRADAEATAEYRRIQNIEREIERIDRIEAERERAAQQERADRRRDYYEELDRQEAEKKHARKKRHEWNWGDIPDGEGGNLNSFMSRRDNNKFSDYDKSITADDIQTLRDIGHKSINDFTAEDTEKSQKWAYKFWQQLGTKSPFFRAWFGDWRKYDSSPCKISLIPKKANINKNNRFIGNEDTLWSVQVTGNVFEDTIAHANKEKPYLERLLTNIDDVIRKAVLLDTAVSEKNKANKKGSTQFMHYLYCVVEYNGNPFLAKITVEEYGNDNKHRAYNVDRIKMSSLSRKEYDIIKSNSAFSASNNDTISVSTLFEFVKNYDPKFNPHEVNPVLLNEDGSPKVLYHGTSDNFTEFRDDEMSIMEGSFFFAQNKEDAEAYGDRVVPVYVSLSNPIDYNDMPSEIYKLRNKRAQVEALKKLGYDGWYCDMETGWGEVSAFYPNQIKSATGNIGTFIKDENDIRFMSRNDSDSSGLGTGFDELNTDNADAAENAIGRFEKSTEESQTLKAEPAPILNEDPEVRKEYQELRDRFGTIPQGEDVNSRGDVGVPSRTQKSSRVRQGVRTFSEAKATPDEVVGELEHEIVNGTFSYTPLSDKAANNYAKEMIEADPEEALREWDAVVRGTEPATKKQIALAENLIMEAAALGDTDTAVRLIAEVAAEGTRAGQAVQAFRMIKRLSPMGQLYSLQKAIDKLNRENENRKAKKIELPSERLEDYAKTVTDIEDLQRRITEVEKEIKSSNEKGRLHNEIDSLRKEAEQKKKIAEQQLDDLKDEVADQMPKKWTEKINAWRYLSMLGNPRTHIRNILGNAVFAPTVTLKSKIAAVMEVGVKAINPKYERSQSLTASKAIKEFAAKDAKESLEQLANGGKYNASDEIRDRQKVFSEKNIVGKAINKASEFNSRMLEVEDAMFLRKRYAYALAHYCAANKWNVAHLNANPQDLQRAREFAFREAQRATYRDMNAFSQFLSQASNKLRDGKGFSRVAYWAMEGALPFKKTPANIIKRGIEYSPIGLFNTLTVDFFQLKKGNITGAEYINNLAAGMTGTMVLGLGYLLASLGILRGRNKDDEDEFEKLRGAQEWSVVIGDVSYTIDWLAPMSLPMFVGVELYDQTANSNDKMDMQDFLDSLTAISEPIFSLSMMDGVQSLLQSYSSEGAISDMFISALQSYAGQMTPTILGQLARTIDDTSRNAYYNDKTSWWGNTVMQPVRSTASKIPGLEQKLPARVDAWGRTTEGTNTAFGRFVQNFISPGYWSLDKSTPVDEEIQKIFDETGDESVLPNTAPKQFKCNEETYYLSSDEYVTFAIDRGQTAYAIIEELINSKVYKRMSAEERAATIKSAYEVAAAYAKGNTESGYDAGERVEIKAFKKYGVEYADYILFDALCANVGKQEEVYRALNKMTHLTEIEKSAIWNVRKDASKWIKTYSEYKETH